MYVCAKCIEAHGLATRSFVVAHGPCEVCSELSGDWSKSTDLTWSPSLRRSVGLADDLPVKVQLAKLRMLVNS